MRWTSELDAKEMNRWASVEGPYWVKENILHACVISNNAVARVLYVCPLITCKYKSITSTVPTEALCNT